MPHTPSGKINRKALPKVEAFQQTSNGRPKIPRTQLEMLLVDLWEKVLNVAPLGIQDDFFALGGHSLLAVRLMAKIQETLGKRLPTATLLQAPTPELFARELEAKVERSWSPIVPLRTTGTGKPFFFVHPAIGAVMLFIPIARKFQEDRPFYAIQAPGLHEGSEPFRDMSAQAAYYVQAIRTVQPKGPYLIGGYSYGGLVAVEIARQFVDQGEEVESLIVVDSGSPNTLHEAAVRPPMQTMIDTIIGLGVDLDTAHLATLSERERMIYIQQRFDDTGILPPEMTAARVLGQIDAHHHAMANWTADIKCRLTFLHCTESSQMRAHDGSEFADFAEGWRMHAPHLVDVYDVPGNHFTVIKDPHVQVLGETIRQCLLAVDPLPKDET